MNHLMREEGDNVRDPNDFLDMLFSLWDGAASMIQSLHSKKHKMHRSRVAVLKLESPTHESSVQLIF